MGLLTDVYGIFIGNVIPALAVLMAVVFVHEIGHFVVARLCGIRVAAFSIGFGRELFGFTDKRGTRWKVSTIPLGGYVRFEGDENMASIPDAEMMAAVPESERKGLFYFSSLWKRIAVVTAGPAANFVLAIVVFAAVFALIGRPHILPVAETVIQGSAAERAGFQPGDRIVSVDGERIESFSDLQSIIMLSADETLSIVVERNGKDVTLTATPQRQEQPDRMGGTHRIGVLGITAGTVQFPARRSEDRARARRARDVDDRRPDADLYRATGDGARERRPAERPDSHRAGLGRGRLVGRDSRSDLPDGGAFRVDRAVQSFPDSHARWRAPVLLSDRGGRGRPLSPRVQDLGFRIGFALVIMLFIFVTFNDIANISGIFAKS